MSSQFTHEEYRVPSIVAVKRLPFDEQDFNTAYLIPNFHIHFMPDQALISPPGDQLYWNLPGVTEYYQKQMETGSFPTPFVKYPSKHASRQMQFVNATGRDIYSFIDGTRTAEEIYKAVIEKNHEPYGKFRDSVYDFLREAVGLNHAILSKEKSGTGYTSTGTEEYFVPVHMSFEVTACCNARCKHCYGSFEHIRDDMIDLPTAKQLLQKLRHAGVRTIELTGGECTVHPDFPEILEECFRLFDLVAILTNGIDIDDRVFDIVGKNASKALAQICINGTPEFHDDFVQYPGAFEKSTRNITRFAELGVLVRSGMNLTYENGGDIEFVLNHVQNAGASVFAPSWVNMNQGRAASLSCSPDCKNHCLGKLHQFICELEQKYPGFIRYHVEEHSREMTEYNQSCGVGRRTAYITSDGFFHLCPMAIGTGIPGYGTIDSFLANGSWETPFVRGIYQLPAPSEKYCADCESRITCEGCITRGIREFLKVGEKCSWGTSTHLKELLQSAVFQNE